jgi:hypothetical protein
MKPAQVNKLYKQLTPKELADLAIEAIIRHDDDELDLIVDSVNRVTYNCLHHDYISRLQGFERVAAYYGVQHWKLQGLATLAFYRFPENNEVIKSALKMLARLCALEQALIKVCKTERINIDAVKWQASCNVSDEIFSLPVCNLYTDELIDEYTEQFMIAWTGKISK